jgi:hypothetical protein
LLLKHRGFQHNPVCVTPERRKSVGASNRARPLFRSFSAGNPKVLFKGSYATYQTTPDYDVTADGQRFLFAKAGEQAQSEISVVLNWFEELKQKVPTGKK